MKILVVGGARLVGKELVSRLIICGDDVCIITRGRIKDDFGNKVRRFNLDLMNEDDVKELFPREHFDLVYDMMVLSPDNVKERLEILDCNRYLMISSAGVYREHHLGIKEREYDAEKEEWIYSGYPGIDYDTRKRYSEAALISDYYDIPSVRVRYPIVLASEDYTGRLEWYVKSVMGGRDIHFDSPEEQLPFISSRDAAGFLFHLRNESGLFLERSSVNAASKGTMSQRDIMDLIRETVFDRSRLPEFQNDKIRDFEAAPFDGITEYSLDTKLAEGTEYSFHDLAGDLKQIVGEMADLYLDKS